MAIVFTQSNRAQKALLWVFYPALVLAVVVVVLALLLPQIKVMLQVAPEIITSETSTITVNMDFLDSQELQQLQPFTQN